MSKFAHIEPEKKEYGGQWDYTCFACPANNNLNNEQVERWKDDRKCR